MALTANCFYMKQLRRADDRELLDILGVLSPS